jgi:DNA-binding SARP family transcriptional activator/WD40 repeat protein
LSAVVHAAGVGKFAGTTAGTQYVPAVEYRVLGPLAVSADGVASGLGGPKQRVVVAVLVAAAGRPVSVDTLLQALYGDDAAPRSRASLQTYVSNLRNLLGDVIVRQGDAYLLDVATATVDAVEFEDAYRGATGLPVARDVATRLREALAMWRGHPYADVEAHGVLDGEVTRLGELRLSAIEARIDADLASGRHREVVAELDALTVEHPFREHLRAMHMIALYRSGRQAEALRAFGRTRDTLVEDLGVDPSPELRELERRILVQDRDLLGTVSPKVQRRVVLVADIDDAGWNAPAERELAFAKRESLLASATGRDAGLKLAPRGTAGYVVFAEPIQAIRAAEAVADERTRVAIDVGDVEIRDGEPVGPPLARAARLVAVAHPGQVVLSSAAHDALTDTGEAGWAAESLGRFDIVGLDPGAHLYQLVGNGFRADFPELCIDRLPPPVPDEVARSVPGFELRGLIGGGQLGEVHRAYQPSVGREVAVRIFGPGMVGDSQFVRRFETAAQRMTRVEHPRVVPLLDYWREPNRAVMVSRLMTGGDLTERIPADGMEPADALTVFEAVASGVAFAHRHGVVHGRIRPENVLFDIADNAYVADLGVDEICTGIVSFATTAYDAPERLGGALATPAADVYSLGVLAHHLLGGSAPPPDGPLPVGADAVGHVVGRATDPEPGRRHQSVTELLADLAEALRVPIDPTAMFVPSRNPYRGLKSFEQADADDFFGRDEVVAEMVAMLDRAPLLLVVGPSGIGKSSVVKAGLVPALSGGAITGSDRWLVTEMTPGGEPFDHLADALERVANVALSDTVGELTASPAALDATVRRLVPRDTVVLIVIDQLEELFTHTVDDAERRAFLRMIIELANQPDTTVRVVATLRADFFDRPLGYPGFADAVRGRTLAVGAMSVEELADAVRLPAAAVGVQLEPALVERISDEAAEQPGALPLVQHTMVELFDRRDTNTITVAAFENTGGLAGSIGRRAEAIHEALDDGARSATRRLFLHLVNVSDDHEDTRRRVRRTELDRGGVAADDLDTVLTEYGCHRLLTFDRDPITRTPTVELAHEALLTEWGRYRNWIDEARDDLLSQRRVETAAHEWLQAGSDPSFLYAGGRLELTESWAATSGADLTDNERRFLRASRVKVDRDRAARTNRRRFIVGSLVAALVVATTMAGFALAQRRDADRRATVTRARELASEAQLAIAEDPERAVLLALAAADTTEEPLPESVAALHRTTQATRLDTTTDGVMTTSFDLSPDGSLIATDRVDAPGYVLIDPADGEVVTEHVTDRPPASEGLSFDPSGDTLAVAYADGDPAVERFAVPSGRLVGSLTGPPGSYGVAEHDHTGRRLAAVHVAPAGSDEIVVWELDSNSPPRSLGPGVDFTFIAESDSILVLRPEGGLTVVDVVTGDAIREIETPEGIPYDGLDVDEVGHRFVVSSLSGRRADVLDLSSGELLATISLPSPHPPLFSADGRWLAAGGNDSFVRLFDTESFTERMRLATGPSQQWGYDFSPDGSRLVSASRGQLRYWTLSPRGHEALGNFQVLGGYPGIFAVAADESTALVSMYEGAEETLQRVDLGTGESEMLLDDLGLHNSNHPVPTHDLSTVAAVGGDWVTHITDLAAGRTIELDRCEVIRAFDRTGRYAVVDGQQLCEPLPGFSPPPLPGPGISTRVVDLETGNTVLDLGANAARFAALGPTGDNGVPTIVAVTDDIRGATVHDLTTGAELGSYAPEDDFVLTLAMSRDGRRLALGTSGGELIVIDVAALARVEDAADAIEWSVTAHTGSVNHPTFSDTGWIVTSSSSGKVRVWTSDGDLFADLPIQPDDHSAIAFAPGTDTLYYEDGGGVIRRFSIDADEMIQLARSMVTRSFTPEECARYFNETPCPQLDV